MTLVYPVQSLAAHPPRLSPAYKSTVKRSPSKPLIPMRHTLSELTGPVYGHETVRENDHDLHERERVSSRGHELASSPENRHREHRHRQSRTFVHAPLLVLLRPYAVVSRVSGCVSSPPGPVGGYIVSTMRNRAFPAIIFV